MSPVALITGSSRGIGAATALRLAKQGYDICINYNHDEKSAHEIRNKIIGLGQKVIAIQADVSLEEDVNRLFQCLDLEFGRLDALVNNAGVLFKQMPVEQMTAERINKTLTTNITSCFLCSKYAIKRMSLKHGGRGGVIVNVSSAASRLGSAGEYVDYAASKGAIDTFTIGLAQEVANQCIRVNAVRPAFIYTGMHADGGEVGRVDRIKSNIPMQRGGTAEEVAAAIAWLVSDESSFTAASFIDVTGGK